MRGSSFSYLSMPRNGAGINQRARVAQDAMRWRPATDTTSASRLDQRQFRLRRVTLAAITPGRLVAGEAFLQPDGAADVAQGFVKLVKADGGYSFISQQNGPDLYFNRAELIDVEFNDQLIARRVSLDVEMQRVGRQRARRVRALN